MAMTPRRWRRRIFVTSRLAAPSSVVPRDLSIRLPQVHRHDIEHLVMLLPEEPRYRELDKRRGVRVCDPGRGELDPDPHRSEHLPVQDGTVADRKHLSRASLDLSDEGLRTLYDRLTPAQHRPRRPAAEQRTGPR